MNRSRNSPLHGIPFPDVLSRRGRPVMFSSALARALNFSSSVLRRRRRPRPLLSVHEVLPPSSEAARFLGAWVFVADGFSGGNDWPEIKKPGGLAFPSQVMRIGDATATEDGDYWIVLPPKERERGPPPAPASRLVLISPDGTGELRSEATAFTDCKV